jgi:lactate dehydrogenase-like 2-hydroxyacid dehydrogenase
MVHGAFQRIVLVDIDTLDETQTRCLSRLSDRPLAYVGAVADISPDIAAQTDCLLLSVRSTLDKAALRAFGLLRLIGVYGTSTRQIDVLSARAQGVQIATISDYCNYDTAEFAVTVAQMYFRNLLPIYDSSRIPVQVRGRTLGVLGFGRIGREVAELAQRVGLNIRRASSDRAATESPEFLTATELFSVSDIVTVHVPPNVLVITAPTLERAQRTRCIIHTSLGLTIDFDALENWLSNSANTFVIDSTAAVRYRELSQRYSNCVSLPVGAYQTQESMAVRGALLVRLVEEAVKQTSI